MEINLDLKTIDLKTILLAAGLVLVLMIFATLITCSIYLRKILKEIKIKLSEIQQDSNIQNNNVNAQTRTIQQTIEEATNALGVNSNRQSESNERTQVRIAQLNDTLEQLSEGSKNSSQQIIDTLKETLETIRGTSKIDVEVFNSMLNNGIEKLSLEKGNYDFEIKKTENSIGTARIQLNVYQSQNIKPVIPTVPCSYQAHQKIYQMLTSSGNESHNILLLGDSQSGKTHTANLIPKCFGSEDIVCVLRIDALDFTNNFEQDQSHSLAMKKITEEFQKKIMELAKSNPEKRIISIIHIDELDNKKDLTRGETLVNPEHLKGIIDTHEDKRKEDNYPQNLVQHTIASANNPELFEQRSDSSIETTDSMSVLAARFGNPLIFNRIKNYNHAAYVFLTLLSSKQYDSAEFNAKFLEQNPDINTNSKLSKLYMQYIYVENTIHRQGNYPGTRNLQNSEMSSREGNQTQEEKDRNNFSKMVMSQVKIKMRTQKPTNREAVKMIRTRVSEEIEKIIGEYSYTVPENKKTELQEKITELVQNFDLSQKSDDVMENFVCYFVKEILNIETSREIAIRESEYFSTFHENTYKPFYSRTISNSSSFIERLMKIAEDQRLSEKKLIREDTLLEKEGTNPKDNESDEDLKESCSDQNPASTYEFVQPSGYEEVYKQLQQIGKEMSSCINGFEPKIKTLKINISRILTHIDKMLKKENDYLSHNDSDVLRTDEGNIIRELENLKVTLQTIQNNIPDIEAAHKKITDSRKLANSREKTIRTALDKSLDYSTMTLRDFIQIMREVESSLLNTDGDNRVSKRIIREDGSFVIPREISESIQFDTARQQESLRSERVS